MALCSVCRSVPLKFFKNPGEEFTHHERALSLETSAENGCHLCVLIWHALSTGVYSSFGRESPSCGKVELIHTENARGYSRIDILEHTNDPRSSSIARVGNPLDFDFLNDPEWRNRSLQLNPASDASLNTISGWIESCLETHINCSDKKAQNKFVPTRLIEVGSDSDSNSARLIITADHELEDRRYVTLSHCWGKNPRTEDLTREETLQARLECIPLSSLCKTFQDAIFITRKLGISYLWIDSFCIIQGLALDFERECKMMAQVYLNGYCTIAATAAASGQDGCFSDRKWMEVTPCSLDIKLESNDEEPVLYFDPCEGLCLRDTQKVNIYPHLSDWEDDLKSGPLQKRAWVLQERELSPRIVHFAHSQTVWECRTSKETEIMPVPNFSSTPKRIFDKLYNEEAVSFSFSRWYGMLEDFTRRDITFSSDRLPAVEGLAQEIMRRYRYIYIAGLWKEDLIYGLRWNAMYGNNNNPNVEPLVKVSSCNVPSWSWAAVEGPIEFSYQRRQPSTYEKNPDQGLSGNPEIIDIGLTPDGGYLKLRGVVRKHSVGKPTYSNNNFYLPGIPGPRPSSIQFDVLTPEPPPEIWLLRMIEFHSVKTTKALALLPVENSPNKYVRVGWAHLNSIEYFKGVEVLDITIV